MRLSGQASPNRMLSLGFGEPSLFLRAERAQPRGGAGFLHPANALVSVDGQNRCRVLPFKPLEMAPFEIGADTAVSFGKI